MTLPDTKRTLRRRLLGIRAGLDVSARRREQAAIGRGALRVILATAPDSVLVPPTAAGMTIAAYVPLGPEPGSLALLEYLHRTGGRVLLPHTGAPGPLSWKTFTGRHSLVRGRFGLAEPPGPTLGADALATADVVLVPAVAIGADGTRLGRGGGYYDRSLDAVAGRSLLVGLVRDEEFLPLVPGEPHDVRVDVVVTPTRIVRTGAR